ncbi:MAG: phosphatase PAP2 family protein [Bacteroidota bacterium]
MRLALFLALLGGAAAAQDLPDLPPDTEPYEVAVFRSIYEIEAPAFTIPMHLVNESAYPAYYGAAPALFAGAAVAGEDLNPAVRLGVAQVTTVGITVLLKRVINRPRPYVALDGVEARDERHMGDDIFDPYSFPSGHTSSSFAIATSLSLSYPEWYVIAPSAVWASAMGVTRIWHGVHYPTDVLVGALIGTASGVAVHLLMPDVLGDDGDPEVEAARAAASAPVRFVVPL